MSEHIYKHWLCNIVCKGAKVKDMTYTITTKTGDPIAEFSTWKEANAFAEEYKGTIMGEADKLARARAKKQ